MAFNDMFQVFSDKKISDEEINKIPSFMFCKWLSNNPGTVMAANQINIYYDIPMVNQFYMIRKGFEGKKIFIKFLKNNKDEDKILELISDFYKISLIKAKEYKSLMKQTELDELVEMYKNKG